MVDIEDRNRNASNPYTGPAPRTATQMIQEKLKYTIFMLISGYVLHTKFNMYSVILKSPHVSHEWFKIGLAGTVALLGIKAYVEVFKGRMQKREMGYDNFRNETHAAIAIWFIAALAFHLALFPHYKWNTPVVLSIFFFGMCIPFMLCIPTLAQNLLTTIALTFFIQVYK